MRYKLNISFKQSFSLGEKRTETILEPFKTLKEAKEMGKSLIDQTVRKAIIIDSVTQKIEYLKKEES